MEPSLERKAIDHELDRSEDRFLSDSLSSTELLMTYITLLYSGLGGRREEDGRRGGTL